MLHTISIDQIKVGLYIHLDLHWMEHPFGLGSFRIKSDEQIHTLRALGLQQIRFDPAKSDVQPLPPIAATAPAAAPAAAPAPIAPATDDPALVAKRQRLERLRLQREAMIRVEKNYLRAANSVRNLQQGLDRHPAQTVTEATRLVEQMVSEFLEAPEVSIHALGSRPGVPDVFVHALNVAVLSLLLARHLRLPAAAMRLLGQGALFHDVGLADVPSRILRNTDPLSAVERAARELHCEYGLRRTQALGLPPEVRAIIEQHHELADGSGYPNHLKGDAIAPLARIVAVANQYDNLCNPVNPALALTPHEALSRIFRQQKACFDPGLLQGLIRSLGVYPPGTLVSLSNEAICVVTSVNPARALKPVVVVYEPAMPDDEPMIIDLALQPEVNISAALRPAAVSREVREYLRVRSRVSYYFDSATPSAPAAA